MGWSQVPWNAIIENNTDTNSKVNGTQTTKRNISKEGVDKIMYDILSSDSGLAALATGENGSGGFNSSTKGLMAQDLAVKLAGEIANLTAETTVSTNQQTEQDKQSPVARGLGTIICTHMRDRGLLAHNIWKAGVPYTLSLPARTVLGYQFWAEPIVAHMQKHPDGLMERFWRPIVDARYEYIVRKRFNLIGALTVHVMQPMSYVIGFLIGVPNGRYANI